MGGSAKEGFQAGATVGAVTSPAFGLSMYGTTVGMTTVATLVGDAVVSPVLYGIGGARIATALGRRRTEA